MSTENPFSDRHPYQQPTSSRSRPQSTGGNSWLTFLAIFCGIGMLFCCGLGSVAYFALRQVGGISSSVTLPDRGNTRQADQAQFNQSLANLGGDPCVDPDVCDFVNVSLESLRAGDSIPFSREMFIEAVAASSLSEGSLGIVERIAIRNWMDEYEPTPSRIDDQQRILDVRMDETGKFAAVDLLSYSSDSQALSQQWFLVKEDNAWKMYDWQRMEYGRRMSDEYAGYMRGESPEAEGYDLAMQSLVEAKETWLEGDQEQARREFQACEQIPMLGADIPVAKLRTAYTWMALDQYDETIRVLKSIDDPDAIWGVWPVLAVSYLAEGDSQLAMEAGRRAEKQSPNHPNVQSLLSTLYTDLGRTDEAADALAAALKVCPDDASMFGDVLAHGRPEDIPLLLDALVRGENEYGWSRLFSRAASSTEWAQALVQQISARDDIPLGVAELAAGNLAWSQEDFDTAAQEFILSRANARLAFLQSLATHDHVLARLRGDQFAELFNETENIDETISTLIDWAYEDELYGDYEKLLAALEQESVRDSPWAFGLSGWVHFELGQHEEAIADFDRFLQSLESGTVKLEDEQQWVINSTEYYVAKSMLELGRPLDVLARWPDDVPRHEQLGSYLLEDKHASEAEVFLKVTSDVESDSVRLQRLRLLAAAAMRSGAAEECDVHHREAISLAASVFGEEQSHLTSGLVWRRARDLVWNRLEDVEVEFETADSEFPLRDQLFTTAVSEAANLADSSSLNAWLKRSEEAGIHSGETYAALQQSLAEYRMSEGDYSGAIQPLKASLSDPDVIQRWYYSRRRQLLTRSMLEAQQSEELREWLADHSDGEDKLSVPTDAIIALAGGDSDSLMQKLEGVEESEIASWLSDSAQRVWLERQAGKTWVQELLKQHPIRMSFYQSAAAGELLLASDAALNEQRMGKLLADALGEPFEVTPVTGPDADEVAAYVATSPEQQRLLLSWSLRGYETDALPRSLAEILAQPVRRLMIEILDSKPQATKRLFAVAAAAADRSAIAFSWHRESQTWLGPELKQQLQWRDRVPVNPSVLHVSLNVRFVPQEEDADYVDFDQWAERLQDAGGKPLPVDVTRSTGLCSEIIRCQLEGTDIASYSLQVRAGTDSRIDPLVKAGISYTSGLGYVSVPKD